MTIVHTCQHCILRHILILCSHLCLGTRIPSSPLPSDFTTTNSHASVVTFVCDTCFERLTVLELIILIAFGGAYKLWSSSKCDFSGPLSFFLPLPKHAVLKHSNYILAWGWVRDNIKDNRYNCSLLVVTSTSPKGRDYIFLFGHAVSCCCCIISVVLEWCTVFNYWWNRVCTSVPKTQETP